MSQTTPPSIDSDSASGLRALLAVPVLTVADRDWTGRDLVAAGAICGRWAQLEDDLARALAVLRDWTPPADAVKAGMRDLRYGRKLISADEFSEWLKHRHLTPGDVSAAVRRRLAREHAPGAEPAGADADEVLRALPAEAVCTDALSECGRWLVDRVLCLPPSPAPPPSPDEVTAACDAEDRLLAAAVIEEPAGTRRERISLMLAADAAYRSVMAEIASPSAIAREVRRRALDWIRFELVTVTCASEGAAAEVAALLREGTPVETVLELSGADSESRLLYLEDAPEAAQGWLGGAVAGEVVGPLPGETTAVWLVKQRWAPDPDEPVIAARARTKIVDEQMRRRRAGRVRWHDRN